jgi:hypothetical protein
VGGGGGGGGGEGLYFTRICHKQAIVKFIVDVEIYFRLFLLLKLRVWATGHFGWLLHRP